MSSSKYIFTLDLRSVQSQISLPVTQGDTNRTLIISFSDGAKPYVLGKGASAMLSILRPTGTPVQEYCKVDEGGACATYNFSEYTVAVSGLHKCQLVLYNAEGKQIASPKFSIDAAPKLVTGDDVVIPDDEVVALDAIYTAEARRVAAELSRADAEAQRVNAEAARKSASEKALSDLNTVKESIEQKRDNGEFDGKDGADGISASHSWDGTVLTMTSASGTSSADLKGEKGDTGPQGVQGIQGAQGPQGIQGVQGEKGEKGDGFSVEKTYSSISAMNAGFATDGVPFNALVLINTGNVEDVDNAKLFIKLENGYSYLTDLSGAQGIQGERGPQGPEGPQGPKGNDGPQGIQGNPGQTGAAGVGISKIEKTSSVGNVDTYTITLTNGAIHYFTVTNGTDGKDGTSVTVTKVVESTEDGGVNVITLSNGQTINIKNGSKGTAGSPGATGATGATGPQGPQGPAGEKGDTGEKGADGEDYVLTDADKNQIAAIVLELLGGEPIHGYIDENNNIVLKGNLAEDKYSVKYEMEDENGNISYIEIGDLVFDNTVTYTVTKTHPNCTFSGATEAVEGESYSATITANDGYELSTLTATMEGGGSITADKATGKISTSNVTGKITITAEATLIPVVEKTNFCVPLGEGWISGGRCSSSGADREDSEAFALTNYIAVQNGDILSVQNLAVSTSTYSGLYKADKTAIGGFTFPTSGDKSGYVKEVSINGGECQFTIDNANAGYIRICGTPSNVKNANGSKFEDKYDINNLGIVINIKRNGVDL